MKAAYIPFTIEEDNILRQHYFSMGAAKLSRSDLLNRTGSQISSRANHIGLMFDSNMIGRHARNQKDVSMLVAADTPFIAYMLGFIWADGCLSKRSSMVGFKIVDRDFADIKERWLATSSAWRYRTIDDGNPRHQIQAHVAINHHDFHDFLVQYDYLFKSGYSANRIINRLSAALRPYWWRGYFDGDGGFTVSGATRRVSLTSVVDQEWDFFQVLANNLKIVYRITRRTTYPSNSNVLIENEASVRRFFDYIYQGEQFGLSRKLNRYNEYIQYKQTVRPNKTSKYRGVCLNQGKWQMAIYHGKAYRESFDVEIEAAQRYGQLATQLFGNRAVLNFPDVT